MTTPPDMRSGPASVRPMPDEPTDTVSLRAVAVARSVDPARQAAEERVRRFIDTALELMAETGGTDFTIQNVVDRSGQSLRSFYHHFEGKHELLLAALEEAIRVGARQLKAATDEIDDPLEKLHQFALGYYRSCRTGPTGDGQSRAAGTFGYQLMYGYPDQSTHAFRPLAALLRDLLDTAARAGVIRPESNDDQTVAFILQSIMFNAFGTTVTGEVTDQIPDRAERLWQMIAHGVT